jgi:hypothetical protein
LILPILVVLDFVLKNKRKKLKKNRASPKQFKTGHLAAGRCKRFVIFSTQVLDMLTTLQKFRLVSTYNQPNLESTQNQTSFLRPKFWAQITYKQKYLIVFAFVLIKAVAEAAGKAILLTG